MVFSCCAPSSRQLKEEQEDVRELKGSFDNGSGLNIIYEQPQSIEIPLTSYETQVASDRPSTSHSNLSQWTSKGRRNPSKASLSFRPKPLRKSSIGCPTDFKHVVEGLPERRSARNSFKNALLNCAIPSGRFSPLPDFDWDSDAGLEFPQPVKVRPESTSSNNFMVQRKPVATSLTSRFSVSTRTLSVVEPSPRPYSDFISEFEGIDTPPLPPKSPMRFCASPSICSVSFPRPVSFRAPSPARPEPVQVLKRQLSFKRAPKQDVEEAIRELNTIVEETRRTRPGSRDTSRSVTPDTEVDHVPAIAPTMKVRARTETLSDIGSAFSTPLPSARKLPLTPDYSPTPASSANASAVFSHTHPNMRSFRFPMASEEAVSSRPSTRSRVSNWLQRARSSSLRNSTASTPFYQCQHPSLANTLVQHSPSASVSTVMSTEPSLIFDENDETPLSNPSSPPTRMSTPVVSARPSLNKSRSMQSLSSMRWNTRARGLSTSSRTSAPLPTMVVMKEEEEYRRSYGVGVAY